LREKPWFWWWGHQNLGVLPLRPTNLLRTIPPCLVTRAPSISFLQLGYQHNVCLVVISFYWMLSESILGDLQFDICHKALQAPQDIQTTLCSWVRYSVGHKLASDACIFWKIPTISLFLLALVATGYTVGGPCFWQTTARGRGNIFRIYSEGLGSLKIGHRRHLRSFWPIGLSSAENVDSTRYDSHCTWYYHSAYGGNRSSGWGFENLRAGPSRIGWSAKAFHSLLVSQSWLLSVPTLRLAHDWRNG